MQVIIKIPRTLFERASNDLHRPHAFAYERAGFFSTKFSKSSVRTLVHCVDYHPIGDHHYQRDNTVGVRIGSGAITEAMSRILAQSVGQIHVHSHGGSGLAGPSGTDSNELPALKSSLQNVDRTKVNGWMILSSDDAWSSLSLPGSGADVLASPLSIIGTPLSVNRREKPITPRTLLSLLKAPWRKKGCYRYSRQSFLGPNSSEQIERTIVGVLGLGGGGSHIVQQLAHLGFQNYVLCDPDNISQSNLNRLVNGTNADVRKRRAKTKIAVRTIRHLQSDANITEHYGRWEDACVSLAGCDVIMGAIDSFCARRDVEAFCRRHLIPYIDIGMDVQKKSNGKHQIFGQVITSIPGEPCMHCMGFLTENILGLEAQKYGAAGGQPQVVWPNGILASGAVGLLVDMITDWSGTFRGPRYITLKGDQLSLATDRRLELLKDNPCPHFPLRNAGDPTLLPL